jgi:hypothetical protein
MPSVPKEKSERVKDAIDILMKLKGLGIPPSDIGYTGTKEVLDAWIADGASRQEEIFFPRALRIAHVTLPALAGQKPTFVLKATEQLKYELAREEEEKGNTQ